MDAHLAKTRTGHALLTALLVLLAACVFGTPASAAPTISGSASLWGYVRDDSVDHTQLVPTLTLTMRQLGTPALRLETSLRGYTDVRGGQSEDRSLRVLRALLVYAPERSPWEVRLGQQWLNEGVGRDHVAGLWARYRVDHRTSITAYGGERVAREISLQERYHEQGEVFGLHLRTHLTPVNVGLSWYYLQNDSKVLYHAAGIDANGRFCHTLNLRGRFELNVAEGSVDRAQFVAGWAARKDLQLTGEFRAQTPRIYEDSFFTLFLNEASTDYARLGARWTFWKKLYARATGMTLFSENPDPLWKAQAAIGCQHIEAGYTHWLSTDKGVLDGFFAQGNYTIRERYEVFGGWDWAKGSNADTDLRPSTESSATYFGAAVTPTAPITLSARAEHVNDIRSTSDWRGLFAATVRFSNLR
jgi:hypothetical protein